MVGFCSGTIAGLVAATPSSGFIPTWASIVLGIVAGGVCNYATKRMPFFSLPNFLGSYGSTSQLNSCFVSTILWISLRNMRSLECWVF